MLVDTGASARDPTRAADAGAMSLDVPYVPQTEALCGGAAVAMVLRYWGAAHASVQEFATLVDRRAHGIVTDALVQAVRQRHWRADQAAGSIQLLRAELAAAHPIVILIEDRPLRYHYVVVIGAGADHLVVHDPAWGPSRRIATAELTRRWATAGFWSLVILPTDRVDLKAGGTNDSSELRSRVEPDRTYKDGEACERLLADAIEQVQQEGLGRSDAIFEDVRAQCPASAGPLRELAGVRFAHRRWRDAAALAQQATAIDPYDEYAWDVLASSRFMQDDVAGALRAWNRIGKPRVDSVRIEGVTRTRYALVADALRLPTGSLLTAERFQRAERRLEQWPDVASARLGYRLESDGFAGVDVAVVEAATRPHGAAEWTARGVRAAVDRELTAAIPGTTGQGELWSASWRWWNDRPRAMVSFATPHLGALPGVWRVDGSWERQTYQPAAGDALVREDHAHGGFAVTNWLRANLRYELSTGLDTWNSPRRAAFFGGSIEYRALGDRLSTTGAATTWMPLTTEGGFQSTSLLVTLRSSAAPSGTVWLADAGFGSVGEAAPMSVWPGAGDGHARTPLLRAHPLVSDGIVSGPVFGRQLAFGNVEAQRWIGSAPVRFAAAAFVDVARASRRASTAAGDPFQVDVGIGLRVKAPGQKGSLRVDFGRGVRDGGHALTVGWQY